MVTICYEYKGERVQLDKLNGHIRAGLSDWGSRISQSLESLQCPVCKDSCRISVLFRSSGSQFRTTLLDVCHPQFYEMANSKLPQDLKMQASSSDE